MDDWSGDFSGEDRKLTEPSKKWMSSKNDMLSVDVLIQLSVA